MGSEKPSRNLRLCNIQAKLSQRYSEASQDHGYIPVLIGRHTVDSITGLALIDDTNLGAQIRRSVDEYLDRRTQDPTLPDQVDAAEARRLNTVQSVKDAAEQSQDGHVSLPSIEAMLLDPRVLHVATCALCQAEVQAVQASWIEFEEG